MAAEFGARPLQLNLGPRATVVHAEVLHETVTIFHDEKFHECRVIEYRGENMVAHTWVREDDGLVLKQDATLWGDRLTLAFVFDGHRQLSGFDHVEIRFPV